MKDQVGKRLWKSRQLTHLRSSILIRASVLSDWARNEEARSSCS